MQILVIWLIALWCCCASAITLESSPSPRCAVEDDQLRIPPLAQDTLRRFAARQRAMLAGPPENMRFVVHGAVHNAGLGNQMQTFTSALLLAILTDRGILVDWPAVKAHDIKYAGNNESELAALPHVDALFRSPGFEWDFWSVKDRIPAHLTKQNIAMVEVSNRYPNVLEMFMCKDINKDLPSRLLLMKAWDNYIPLLMLNPHYSHRVLQEFGIAPFQPLSNYILQPTKSIQQRADEFRQQHFAGKYVIGIQMRSFFMHQSQLMAFWQCAKLLAHLHASRSDVPVVFFLATDTMAARRVARRVFKDLLVHTDVDISRASTEGVEGALIDLVLLEHCDQLVNTAGSSFGRVASARSGRTAHVITASDTCVKQIVTEPCTRLWDNAQNFSCVENRVKSSPLMVNHKDCHDTW